MTTNRALRASRGPGGSQAPACPAPGMDRVQPCRLVRLPARAGAPLLNLPLEVAHELVVAEWRRLACAGELSDLTVAAYEQGVCGFVRHAIARGVPDILAKGPADVLAW